MLIWATKETVNDIKTKETDQQWTLSFENMRTPLATSMKASFWGVVTITAAVNGTTWKINAS